MSGDHSPSSRPSAHPPAKPATSGQKEQEVCAPVVTRRRPGLRRNKDKDSFESSSGLVKGLALKQRLLMASSEATTGSAPSTSGSGWPNHQDDYEMGEVIGESACPSA